MYQRKTKKLVTFHVPFQLRAMEEMRPAGTYEVTTEEQQIGDFMYDAFQRVATTIYLPSRASDYGMGQIIPVDPLELEALMKLTCPTSGSAHTKE